MNTIVVLIFIGTTIAITSVLLFTDSHIVRRQLKESEELATERLIKHEKTKQRYFDLFQEHQDLRAWAEGCPVKKKEPGWAITCSENVLGNVPFFKGIK